MVSDGFHFGPFSGYFYCGATLPAYLRIQHALVFYLVRYVFSSFEPLSLTHVFDVPCASVRVCPCGQKPPVWYMSMSPLHRRLFCLLFVF